jgi:hypothetical protein
MSSSVVRLRSPNVRPGNQLGRFVRHESRATRIGKELGKLGACRNGCGIARRRHRLAVAHQVRLGIASHHIGNVSQTVVLRSKIMDLAGSGTGQARRLGRHTVDWTAAKPVSTFRVPA